MEKKTLFIEEKLPKTLSDEDTYIYFEKYNSGDMAAREILINHNIRLVIDRVLYKFNYIFSYQDEFVSVGLIGLIKAVDTFNTNKGYRFSTYATRCIDNEIIDFLIKERKYMQVNSLDSYIFNNDDVQVRLVDTLYDENSFFTLDYEEKELILILNKIISNLSEKEKKLLFLYFGFENNISFSQTEIAKKYGVSQAYISKIYIKLIKKIRLILETYGYICYESPKKKIKK